MNPLRTARAWGWILALLGACGSPTMSTSAPRSSASPSDKAPVLPIMPVMPVMPVMSAVGDVDCKTGSNSDDQNRNLCLKMDAQQGRVAELDRKTAAFAWSAFITLNGGDRPRWSHAPWTVVSPEVVDTRCDGEPTLVADVSNRLDPTWLRLGDPPDGLSAPAPDARLWDQHGQGVLLETRFNRESVNFGERDPLGNLRDQLVLSCQQNLRVARWSMLGAEEDGPIRLKLAWKRLGGDDRQERFVLKPDAPEYGLVAMHVAIKTDSTRDLWLWATFEHRNNVEELDGSPPSFRRVCDSGEDCPADNVCWTDDAGVKRTQVVRLTPIPEHVAEVNTDVQRGLAAEGSVLQYYELIGAQRPFAAACAPPDPGRRRNPQIVELCEPVEECRECAAGDDACMQRCGGVPRPYVLANTLIEWDHQRSSCMGCHSAAETWNVKPNDCASLTDDACDYQIRECEDTECTLDRRGTCEGAATITARRAWRSVGTSPNRGALVPNGDMFFPFQLTKPPRSPSTPLTTP